MELLINKYIEDQKLKADRTSEKPFKVIKYDVYETSDKDKNTIYSRAVYIMPGNSIVSILDYANNLKNSPTLLGCSNYYIHKEDLSIEPFEYRIEIKNSLYKAVATGLDKLCSYMHNLSNTTHIISSTLIVKGVYIYDSKDPNVEVKVYIQECYLYPTPGSLIYGRASKYIFTQQAYDTSKKCAVTIINISLSQVCKMSMKLPPTFFSVDTCVFVNLLYIQLTMDAKGNVSCEVMERPTDINLACKSCNKYGS